MYASTTVIARDPVDPRALFDAARAAAGGSGDWALFDEDYRGVPRGLLRRRSRPYRDVPMYYAACRDATVSAHFAAGGGLLPSAPELEYPDGYVLVLFGTGYFTNDVDGMREYHTALVRTIGEWLNAGGVRWAWSFEDDPWIHGAVPPRRGART